MVGKGAGKVVKTGGKTAGGIGAGGVGAYNGVKAGMRNNNTKPVPPRNPDQKASQHEQQFSTNAVNNPNVESKTNTVPTKPNTSVPNRNGSLASTIPINTSDVSGSDSGGGRHVSRGTKTNKQTKQIVKD